MEHLVESHMGGYYISSLPRDIIEKECEECYDRDTIVASWTKGDEIDRYYSLVNYFSNGQLKTKEDIENALSLLDYEDSTLVEKFESIINDIVERYDYTLETLYDLVCDGYISCLEYEDLCHMANNNSYTELSLVRLNLKEFLSSPIDIAKVKSTIRHEKRFYKEM